MSNAPYEPTSVSRSFAKTLFDTYQALTQEGFTEPQAIQLIGHILAATMGGSNGSTES